MDFIEEIEEQICTNFKVTRIPVGELKKFKKMCKEEYGDIYWVGIVQLMKSKEKYENLLSLFSSLKEEINELKAQLNKKGVKTFG